MRARRQTKRWTVVKAEPCRASQRRASVLGDGRSTWSVVAAVIAVLAGAIAGGCGGSAGTNCGTPYRFDVGGKTVTSGTCAGRLPLPPPDVTVRRGQVFSVEIADEANGALVFPIPDPQGTVVRLLKHHGQQAVYVGVSTGATRLVARKSPFCGTTSRSVATCPVLRVHVVPR